MREFVRVVSRALLVVALFGVNGCDSVGDSTTVDRTRPEVKNNVEDTSVSEQDVIATLPTPRVPSSDEPSKMDSSEKFDKPESFASVDPRPGEPFLLAVTSGEIEVEVLVDLPTAESVDALVVYTGTVKEDANLIPAATNMMENVRGLVGEERYMIVSVAYPQEFKHIGDNLPEAETALRWVQQSAAQELDVEIKKTFLIGHSQGGYLVTRLNALYKTDGVVANAPGPLDLHFRCELEERGRISRSNSTGGYCERMQAEFGTTDINPGSYRQRSLLSHAQGFKADILFVQGLDDSPIQMRSWEMFQLKVKECADCQQHAFMDVEGEGHSALFSSARAGARLRAFLTRLD